MTASDQHLCAPGRPGCARRPILAAMARRRLLTHCAPRMLGLVSEVDVAVRGRGQLLPSGLSAESRHKPEAGFVERWKGGRSRIQMLSAWLFELKQQLPRPLPPSTAHSRGNSNLSIKPGPILCSRGPSRPLHLDLLHYNYSHPQLQLPVSL
jgi:hypothetical protein